MDYPLDCYKDDPKSIGAAVQRACVKRGLFSGQTLQRSELLWVAQHEHRTANDGKRCAEQETLGRELRHRNGMRQHFYDRALAQGWRIFCDKGRVWAERV